MIHVYGRVRVYLLELVVWLKRTRKSKKRNKNNKNIGDRLKERERERGGGGEWEEREKENAKKNINDKKNQHSFKHNSCPSIWLVCSTKQDKNEGTQKTKKKVKKKIIIIETVLLRLTTRLKTKH